MHAWYQAVESASQNIPVSTNTTQFTHIANHILATPVAKPIGKLLLWQCINVPCTGNWRPWMTVSKLSMNIRWKVSKQIRLPCNTCNPQICWHTALFSLCAQFSLLQSHLNVLSQLASSTNSSFFVLSDTIVNNNRPPLKRQCIVSMKMEDDVQEDSISSAAALVCQDGVEQV